MTTTVSLTVLIFALEMPFMELDLGANVARPSVTPLEDLKLIETVAVVIRVAEIFWGFYE